MKSKIFQKKEDNKVSDFERDISLKDAKSLKVELSSFVYNDFNPDSDEYEEQEISVKKSDIKFKIKDNKGKLKIVLESADIDFDIDDDEQSERFMDKDWETETIFPTLKLTDKSKKEEYVAYDGGHLFTLEVVY
jgi:hypothetical protein|tara:strand:+ start:199 stop:600 length:402 start_codon:yes stop_codon:yes gene_type:complete